jgi:hypothetical protein
MKWVSRLGPVRRALLGSFELSSRQPWVFNFVAGTQSAEFVWDWMRHRNGSEARDIG